MLTSCYVWSSLARWLTSLDLTSDSNLHVVTTDDVECAEISELFRASIFYSLGQWNNLGIREMVKNSFVNKTILADAWSATITV